MITRAMVLEFNNPQDSAALAVWVACRALTDRGLRGPPSEGWPRFTGMSARGFYNAKRRAIELGLIKTVPGSAGIAPIVRYDGGQFSRVPVEVLFDQTLSRPEKRVFVALSLYSSGFGDSRPAVATIAKASATSRRGVQRALRELENRCHIIPMGAIGRGSMRYFVKGQAIPTASTSRPQPKAQTGTQSRPKPPQTGTQSRPKPPQTGTQSRPKPPQTGTQSRPKPALRAAPSREGSLRLQERRAPTALANGPSPRAEQQPPTKTQAQAILRRFSMKSPGSDFGKDCLQEGQQERRVADPPATWTAKDFKSAIQSAEASLGDATATEAANAPSPDRRLFRPD